MSFQVIVEKKRKRSAKDLVGKPVVHDPTWLTRLRRFSEQQKGRQQREKQPE